jgi:ketosteroid isomerase-like protein
MAFGPESSTFALMEVMDSPNWLEGHMKTICVAVLLAIVTLGCSRTAGTPEWAPNLSLANETAVRSVIDGFGQAFGSNDAAGVAAYQADDFVAIEPTALVGKNAAQEMFETVTLSSFDQTIMRIDGSGHLAYAWVEYEVGFTPPGGNAVIEQGNSLWVLKKNSEGVWQMVANCYKGEPISVPEGE